MEPEDVARASRRSVISAGVLGAVLGGVTPAWAGYVTSLGIETTKPKDAEKDDELLSSKEVQKSIQGIKGYKSAAKELGAKFSTDTTMPLIPTIRKDFDFSKVRDDLNIAATVFDDETQKTTDRISRSILYDLTELEGASRLKKGETERTEKKIANVQKWFAKLEKDFDVFLEYFPAELPKLRAPPAPPPSEEAPAPSEAPAAPAAPAAE